MNGTRSSRRRAAAFLALSAAASSVSAQDAPFHASLLDNWDSAGDSYSDVWADGNYAYMGRFGLNVVDVLDISDPNNITNPVSITVPSPNNGCSAQDVKVGVSALDPSVTLGFISFDGTGPDEVGIYDLSTPTSPTLLTRISIGTSFGTSHNTSYREDGWLVISNSWDSELHVIDLRTYDPASPPSTITSTAYSLFGIGSGFVHDITINDDFLYVAEWNSLRVFDVSNLGSSAPSFLGAVEGYSCHAVWPTADNAYVVTTDERGGGAMRLWKMTDNGSSVTLRQVDSWRPPASGPDASYSAHNPVVVGDRAFVSSYSAGVLVYQIDRTDDTWEKVASYDTSGLGTSGYFGCWGVYPFLGHDLVVASDLENGLYTIDFSALQITSPTARPKFVTPFATTSISIDVEELGNLTNSGTVRLYTSIDDAPFTFTAMSNVGGTTWQGDLPGAGCGQKIDYYFRATANTSEQFYAPADAPTNVYTCYASLSQTVVFEDDFNANNGWSVSNSGVTNGAWERGVPVETGMQPGYDSDGDSGNNCYITENGSNDVSSADLDGGPTTLTSPLLDFSAGDGVISYEGWQATSDVDSSDGLLVEITGNNGSTWVPVSNVSDKAGGWVSYSFRVSDFVAPSANVRVRFVVSDNPNDSITEAGVDDFVAEQFCQDPLATATFRNGTGVNNTCLSSNPPVIGAVWTSTITHSGHPGATLTALLMHAGGATGPVIAGGELLLDLSSPKLLSSLLPVTGTSNDHSFQLPADSSIAGIGFSAQGAILGGGYALCNGYDYTIGF